MFYKKKSARGTVEKASHFKGVLVIGEEAH